MKKYVNRVNKLRHVKFADGTTQFLMRGQSVESSVDVIQIQEGIVVKDVKQKKKTNTVDSPLEEESTSK